MNNMLSIIFITYNRADLLDDSLSKFSNSPFADCKITILDNASTDSTPLVCKKYSKQLKQLNTVRNSINIGGDANFLRAVETSKSTYTWILCDDDFYDFSSALEVLKAMETNIYDALVVGPIHPEGFQSKGSRSAQKLFEEGFWFHYSLSFFPSIIFKTEIFNSNSLVKGYKNIFAHYPNFPFINSLFKNNKKIFIPEKQLVIRNEVGASVLSPFEWYISWVNCCQNIEDLEIRKKTIQHATQKNGFYKCLMFWIAIERHINRQQFYQKIFTLLFGLPLIYKLTFPVFLPVILVTFPLKWLITLRKYVYKLLKVPESQIPPVLVIDRDNLND